MKGTYKRELNSSYLVLEEQPMNSTQYYQMKMITENQIDHLLKVSIHNFNGESFFYYDISGKQALTCIFEKREMENQQLISILSDLSKVLSQLEVFFLEENYLCLDPEYMFMNINTNKLFFCFYPLEEKDFYMGIRQFAEYLLGLLNHEDEKAVAAGYQFYRFTREDNFILSHIVEEILTEWKSEEKLNEKTNGKLEEDSCQIEEYKQNAYEEEIPLDDYSDSYPMEAYPNEGINFKVPSLCFLLFILAGIGYGTYQYFLRTQLGIAFTVKEFLGTRDMILAAGAIIVGVVGFLLLFFYKRILKSPKEKKDDSDSYSNTRETSHVKCPEESECICEFEESSEYEETVLLKENIYEEEGVLIEKTGRFDKKAPLKIVLSHYPFIIGKLEGSVDYLLLDKSVSRMHAKFIKKDQEDMVYIMDLNSKNGTLKNGIPLEVNELVPLTAEDEITFGKVTFTYH